MEDLNEYWDVSEFKFFNTLEDEDKLLYLYDLFVGDFTNEFFSLAEDDDIDFESDFDDSEDTNELHQQVVARIDKPNSKLTLSGATEDILAKVATDLMMNGMILTAHTIVSEEGSPLKIEWDMIGEGNPISLN